MTLKGPLSLLAGLMTIILLAESAARLAEDYLPQRSAWPTVESELKHDQLADGPSPDVVFLGSSSTEAAIDPDLLPDYNAYNAALPFSTPISNRYWYEGQFEPLTGRIVVLGLLPLPDHHLYEEDPLVGRIRAAQTERSPTYRVSALLGHAGVAADWSMLKAHELSIKAGLWTDRGHQTVYYNRTGGVHTVPPPFEEPTISHDVRDAVHELADAVNSDNGRLVLMIEPGRKRSDVNPIIVEAYLTELEELAADVGAPLWDLYSIDWPSSQFVDTFHVNQAGTVRVTSYVAGLLKRLDN